MQPMGALQRLPTLVRVAQKIGRRPQQLQIIPTKEPDWSASRSEV